MLENEIRDFVAETRTNDGRTNIFMGKAGGRPAVLKIYYPEMTRESILDCIAKKHQVTHQNDIYQSRQINTTQAVKYTLTYFDSEKAMRDLKSSYSYVGEFWRFGFCVNSGK